jgi:predicted glycosyltransferase
MKVLFDIGHPADVHLFKYIIRNLEKNHHEIKICVRERENIVKNLLEHYDFNYENLEKNTPGLLNKAITMFKNDYKLIKISKIFNPDIYVSLASPYSAQVSKLLGRHSITFTDSEPTGLMLALTMPFTDVIITPSGFARDLGKKQIRISGYKELAYLHPNWFKPKSDILKILGISKNEPYVILRFSAFDASHDIGIKGFSLEDKRRLVKELGKYAKVFISSEVELPLDLEKYCIDIPQNRMHDALYYASMLVGDTQTSTTEAACLGTPAVRCNSFVGQNDMSNFIELETMYGLIFNYNIPEKAMEKSIELIQQHDIKEKWVNKKEKLYNEKIDMTAFLTWFIEDYPESLRMIKENPSFQERFK